MPAFQVADGPRLVVEGPKLDLILEGEPGTIALASFIRALDNARAVIQGVDTALTLSKSGIVEWYVQDLRMGSLQATLVARPRRGTALAYSPAKADEIATAVVSGMKQVEEAATVPDLFPEQSMRRLQYLGNLMRKNGASAFRAVKTDDQLQARVTAAAAEHAKEALKPRYSASGSVVGRLDVVSVHRGRLFTVYDEIHRRPVRGSFADEIMPLVKEALGKRVLAGGIIKRNSAHQMVSVFVENLEIMPEDRDLPTVAELVGSDPEFTGGLPAAEWVRRAREA